MRRQTHRHLGGQAERLIDGYIDKQMERKEIDIQTPRQIEKYEDERIDGRMDGWTEWWVNRRMDRQMVLWRDRRTEYVAKIFWNNLIILFPLQP